MARSIQIVPVFLESFRILGRALRDWPAHFIAAAVLIAGVHVFEMYQLSGVLEGRTHLSAISWIFMLELAAACVYAAAAIVIQRHALLGIRPGAGSPATTLAHFVVYAVIAMVLTALSYTRLILLVAALDGHSFGGGHNPVVLQLVLFAPIVLPVVGLVLCAALLPALAIAAPGATFMNGLLDTRFDLHRIAAVIVLCLLPGAVLGGLLSAALEAWSPLSFGLALAATKTVSGLLTVGLLAAASTLIFRCHASRLTALDRNGP